MKNLQKIGGTASLVAASTNLLAILMFITLSPKGLGSDNPIRVVEFLSDNQALMHAWYLIIYFVFGVSLIFLPLALNERLKDDSPLVLQAISTIGLFWALLVIAMGTLSINNLSTVAKVYSENPVQAVTIWLTLDSVENGLGNNGGETTISALWFLLVSWTALRARKLPRKLNYLGAVTGTAGILSVVLDLPAITFVYGIGLIIWFIWLGIEFFQSTAGREV